MTSVGRTQERTHLPEVINMKKEDYEKWLEELAPQEPIDHYRHNDTGEDNADATNQVS